MIEAIHSIERSVESVTLTYCIDKRSLDNLKMQASQCGTPTIRTAFICRITVRKGAIEPLTEDFRCPPLSTRVWISSSISRLTQDCFANRKSLKSLIFELNSKLHRIEESAFLWSRLTTIQVPASVEVLCKSCFSNCQSLTSVTFELNSKLQQIEECAFARSGLTTIQVPASVEVLCKFCFSHCQSLTSVTFESNSKLHQIEEQAFAWSGLTTIEVPASVEVLCKFCFFTCKSFTSVTFESNSKLRKVGRRCFEETLCEYQIAYPPSLYECSRTVGSRSAGEAYLLIADEE
jgi:hypothetical protein